MTQPAHRIAIIHPEGYLDSVPGLLSTITILARHGHSIDVFVLEDGSYVPPVFQGASVRLHYLDSRGSSGPAASGRNILWWIAGCYRVCRGSRYLCLFGVDSWGLLIATAVGRLLGVRTVYFSLEILVPAESRRWQLHLLKALERLSNRLASFTVVQDRDRAELLARENRVSQSEMVLVPNASLGPVGSRKTHYLRRKFGIPDSKIVLLYAGSLAHWTMALELTQAALDWSEDWVLVLQTRQNLENNSYGRALRDNVDGRHVVLCAHPVSSSEYSDLVGSADIGIALYRSAASPALGDNLRTIGLSSGKIAAYLQHGLPVVTVDFPSLRRLVEGHRCGGIVASAEEVEKAVQEILAQYDTYSANALRCFREQFDVLGPIDQVVHRLEAMGTVPGRV